MTKRDLYTCDLCRKDFSGEESFLVVVEARHRSKERPEEAGTFAEDRCRGCMLKPLGETFPGTDRPEAVICTLKGAATDFDRQGQLTLTHRGTLDAERWVPLYLRFAAEYEGKLTLEAARVGLEAVARDVPLREQRAPLRRLIMEPGLDFSIDLATTSDGPVDFACEVLGRPAPRRRVTA